jgi:hypothetical protein
VEELLKFGRKRRAWRDVRIIEMQKDKKCMEFFQTVQKSSKN